MENKDLFVDLKRNGNGMYLKLSERIGKSRNTVLIPASGIGRLKSILEEILVISASNSSIRFFLFLNFVFLLFDSDLFVLFLD